MSPVVPETVANPFRASYGLIAGTNQYGYTIFIPSMEEAAGAYAGLPAGGSGKQSGRRP